MNIHQKINSRSYLTIYLKGGRFLVPYLFPDLSATDRPRFYFTSDKKTTFHYKK